MHELEIGIVEEVNPERGVGTVRLEMEVRSLFYLRDGKEIIRQPSRLWFSKKRLNCIPKVGTQIVCDRPGHAAVDQWTLLSLYVERMEQEEAVFLQHSASLFDLFLQDTYIEDVLLRKVRAKYPKKKFPRVIRRADMEVFVDVVNSLSYASFLRGERESNKSRDYILEQAAIHCFENKPDGIIKHRL